MAGAVNVQRSDVATARLEYYAEPAALPVVEKSSLKLDLFRREPAHAVLNLPGFFCGQVQRLLEDDLLSAPTTTVE